MEIKRILTCTDFSKAAEPGLDRAFDMAAKLGAHLTVLYVFQRPLAVDPSIAPTSLAQADAFMLEAHKAAEAKLKELVSARGKAGLEVDYALLEGVPHQAIAEASKNADLVVLGTHGYTGAKRLVLGSVAERVVRASHCAVLTVPAA